MRHLKRRRIVNIKVIMNGLRRGLGRLMSKNIAEITRQEFVAAITAIEDQAIPAHRAEIAPRRCEQGAEANSHGNAAGWGEMVREAPAPR